MTTEFKYTLNFTRLISLISFQILFLAFVGLLVFEKINSNVEIDISMIIAFIFLILWIFGVFIVLFVNHFKLGRNTVIKVLAGKFPIKTITIHQNSSIYVFQLTEIKEIVEYSTHRHPWSGIKKWLIITDKNEIWISSLTISSFKFELYFNDKIQVKHTLIPLVKYKV